MDQRLQSLERAVAEIAASLGALEGRLHRVEASLGLVPAVPSEVPTEAIPELVDETAARPSRWSLAAVLALVGRTFLVLGGAFLLRALTESGTLPTGAGIGLGLAYSVAWIFAADRSCRRGQRLSAALHGISAAMICFPITYETTVNFGTMSPPTACVAMVLVTALALAVAWRRDNRLLAWIFTTGCAMTSFALVATTHAIELFAAATILLGVATVWLGYSRKWFGLRWFVAPFSNLLVVQMVALATRPEGLPRPFADLSIPLVQVEAVLLLVVYLSSFAIRTLIRLRDVTAFEVLQSAAALIIGFGGAVTIARNLGSGQAVLGLGALVAAAACYAVAFAFVGRHLGRGRNFVFYTTLALVLTVTGTGLVASTAACALSLAVLAAITAFLGGRFGSATLRAHSAAYAAVAGLLSGLIPAAGDSLFAASSSPWRPLTPSALLVLAVTLACYVAVSASRDATALSRPARWPGMAIAVLAVGELAGVTVRSASLLVANAETGFDPGTVAVVRTAVLAAAAVVLALGGRRRRLVELGWLVYPTLVLGGAKLLFEDLRVGSPSTLFAGFVFFGSALILAPRLARGERSVALETGKHGDDSRAGGHQGADR